MGQSISYTQTYLLTFVYLIIRLIRYYIKTKIPVRGGGKRRIHFYSTNDVFIYEYFTTLPYKITNKSCFVIRSPGAQYNCPLLLLFGRVELITIHIGNSCFMRDSSELKWIGINLLSIFPVV
jgi:hypothetical protein